MLDPIMSATVNKLVTNEYCAAKREKRAYENPLNEEQTQWLKEFGNQQRIRFWELFKKLESQGITLMITGKELQQMSV